MSEPYLELAERGLASILEQIQAHLRRYVVLSDDQACAAVLWVAHTYALDFAYCTPYLNVSSPEKRSGKTRLLEVLATLVDRPWLTGGTSKAALVRKVDDAEPTLLLDESDAAFNADKEYAEALRGVLNNGYTRGKPYTTCIGQGASIKPYDFKVFCPKAIAGIGKLPDTVADRSIEIGLKRRTPGERVERFRQRRAEEEGAVFANALHHLRETGALAKLDGLLPELPDELDDRAMDVWEPLLAIAEVAGGDWPRWAAGAAKSLSAGADPEDDSLGIRLLADCREGFDEHDAISTADLLEHLHAIEEAPWGEWEIKPKRLADLLRPYGIKSRSVRVENKTPKGYRREHFEDAWSRYLASTPPRNATPATTALASHKSTLFDPQHEGSVALGEGPANPHSNADVAGVAGERADIRGNGDNGAFPPCTCEGSVLVERGDGIWRCETCRQPTGDVSPESAEEEAEIERLLGDDGGES